LRRFLRLEGGIPSHDTFSRLFRMLDPDGFEASFGRFVAAFALQVGALQVGALQVGALQVGALQAGGSEVIAVDGRTARRSFDHQGGRRPLHMVPRRPPAGGQRPGGRPAAGARAAEGRRPEPPPAKGEIEALPELLALLALEGRIVTADAMHCHHTGLWGPRTPQGRHRPDHPRPWRRPLPGAEGQPAGAVRGRPPVAR
jgi:hypothetical protein